MSRGRTSCWTDVDRPTSQNRTPRRLPVSRHGLVGLLVPAVDALALLAALSLTGLLAPAGGILGLAAFLVLAAAGSQRPRLNPCLSDDLPPLLGRLATGLLLGGLVLAAVGPRGTTASLVKVTPAAAMLLAAGRGLSYRLLRSARAGGTVAEPTLVIGAGRVGAELATALRQHPEYGLLPIGFLDAPEGTALAMPVLGDVPALAHIVRRNRVTRVIVAFGAMREPDIVRVLRACDTLPVQVYVVPRLFELGVAPAGAFTDHVWGIPLVRLRRPALRTTARRVKRVVDVALASLGLLLAAPVLAACAIVVRGSSPGPVLFRQKRIGQDGQPFELLKFRTLLVNGDSDTTWSVDGDRRQTAVGRFLRDTSLDELPQLFNILRGEMSLVGPRPERPYFTSRFALEVANYDHRHRVASGLTGWAQIHGLRGDTPIPDRARFDNHYIEYWSLWRDLVILMRTAAQLLPSKASGSDVDRT